MLYGDINTYWLHKGLSGDTVRAATYGTESNSGTLIPDVGDVIRDFHGLFGAPITVRVAKVTQIGQGVDAFEIQVVTVEEVPQ